MYCDASRHVAYPTTLANATEISPKVTATRHRSDSRNPPGLPTHSRVTRGYPCGSPRRERLVPGLGGRGRSQPCVAAAGCARPATGCRRNSRIPTPAAATPRVTRRVLRRWPALPATETPFLSDARPVARDGRRPGRGEPL